MPPKFKFKPGDLLKCYHSKNDYAMVLDILKPGDSRRTNLSPTFAGQYLVLWVKLPWRIMTRVQPYDSVNIDETYELVR